MMKHLPYFDLALKDWMMCVMKYLDHNYYTESLKTTSCTQYQWWKAGGTVKLESVVSKQPVKRCEILVVT